MSTSLLDFLLSQNILTHEHVTFGGKNTQKPDSKTVLKALSSAKLINEEKLAQFLSGAFKVPPVKVTTADQNAVRLVPSDIIVMTQCLPFRLDGNTVQVAIADPTRKTDLDLIKSHIQQNVTFGLTTFSNLEAAINNLTFEPKVPKPILSATPRTREPSYPLKRYSARDQVPNIVNDILSDAAAKNASDIHFETQPKGIRVRFRVEGSLHDVFSIPLELKDQLSSRIKVLAGLDISERRVPQDGRFKVQVGKAEYNFRINITPTHHGESIAIRVLRPDSAQPALSEIGLTENQLRAFRKGITSPNGMVLVTGPTGCGKTTTLYTALSELNNTTEKIATVEDPVEYSLDGIVQVQVNNETNLGFATILKALLRQDPDIILVGEIRDQETATIAIQAALTGHMVLSTLHTNDAPSGILRLLNMGIEPFMVLEAVRTIVAQRLVRKICPSCKQATTISEKQLALLKEDQHLVTGMPLFKGAGCDSCLGGGYKGRVAVFEVLELTEPLKELVLKGENPVAFKRQAMEQGMESLRQSALHLVAAGMTTIEEAIASTVDR